MYFPAPVAWARSERGIFCALYLYHVRVGTCFAIKLCKGLAFVSMRAGEIARRWRVLTNARARERKSNRAYSTDGRVVFCDLIPCFIEISSGSGGEIKETRRRFATAAAGGRDLKFRQVCKREISFTPLPLPLQEATALDSQNSPLLSTAITTISATGAPLTLSPARDGIPPPPPPPPRSFLLSPQLPLDLRPCVKNGFSRRSLQFIRSFCAGSDGGEIGVFPFAWRRKGEISLRRAPLPLPALIVLRPTLSNLSSFFFFFFPSRCLLPIIFRPCQAESPPSFHLSQQAAKAMYSNRRLSKSSSLSSFHSWWFSFFSSFSSGQCPPDSSSPLRRLGGRRRRRRKKGGERLQPGAIWSFPPPPANGSLPACCCLSRGRGEKETTHAQGAGETSWKGTRQVIPPPPLPPPACTCCYLC